MHVSGRDVSSRTRHDKSNSSSPVLESSRGRRKVEEVSSRGKCARESGRREMREKDSIGKHVRNFMVQETVLKVIGIWPTRDGSSFGRWIFAVMTQVQF